MPTFPPALIISRVLLPPARGCGVGALVETMRSPVTLSGASPGKMILRPASKRRSLFSTASWLAPREEIWGQVARAAEADGVHDLGHGFSPPGSGFRASGDSAH